MTRPVALALPLLLLAPPLRAQTSVDCADFGCGVDVSWHSSTAAVDLWSGSPLYRVRSLTISGLPLRRPPGPPPYDGLYALTAGPCHAPDGDCRPPYALPSGEGYEFPALGWTFSPGVTSFTFSHPTGVVRQRLYLSDPYSWVSGPTYEWDLDHATITAEVVTPEPAPLALLATGLVGLGVVAWRKRQGAV